MSTTSLNHLIYHVGCYVRSHRTILKRTSCALLCILLIAAALETFVFNAKSFATAGLQTVDLTVKLDPQAYPKSKSGYYHFTYLNHSIEFSHLNMKLDNIRIDFADDQPAQNLDIKVNFTDEMHHTYFDTTEYTQGIPVAKVPTNFDGGEIIRLKPTGYVDSMRLEVQGKDLSYPVAFKGIYANVHYPFVFEWLRFVICASLLGLLWVFRPRSIIYKIRLKDSPILSRAVIVTTVVIELNLVTALLFMGANLVGVATAHYNSGAWDHTSLVNTFEAGGDNAQQYAELARAMAKGQLYLDQEPPQWLKDTADPYDKGVRDELQKQTGEKYLFDVAYYQGHYYVYFGVVPVLLFYLPFYLLTGANFPTAIGVLIAAWAFILGCSALIDRFARHHFKRVSLGVYLLLQIPLIFCSGILYLIKFPTFYSLPIMLALALSVWGLYFWMVGRCAQRRAWAWYLAGSVCMALVAGCRPQFLLLSCLAFPLFWRRFITERHLWTRQGAYEFAALIAPYFVVAAGICWYNKLRFGSFVDFGANYNLTVNDMTKRGWDLGRVAPALFAYFLQTPNTTAVFPFLAPCNFATTYMGQTIKEVTFGGIFACLPFLWVLIFARRALAMRLTDRPHKTVAGVLVCLIACGLSIAILDAQAAGILQRYYADFSFMFLVASVLVVFIVNEKLDAFSAIFGVMIKLLVLLVFVSVLYSVLVCFVPEIGWYSDVYPWAYQRIIHLAQFWM